MKRTRSLGDLQAVTLCLLTSSFGLHASWKSVCLTIRSLGFLWQEELPILVCLVYIKFEKRNLFALDISDHLCQIAGKWKLYSGCSQIIWGGGSFIGGIYEQDGRTTWSQACRCVVVGATPADRRVNLSWWSFIIVNLMYLLTKPFTCLLQLFKSWSLKPKLLHE